MFRGFPQEAVSFLAGLEKNNRKDWFEANRGVYERAVKQPTESFCAEMVEALRKMTGEAHRSRIFRVHRDLRFSKDKTPYNAHIHIAFVPADGGENPPGWFFGLVPGRLSLGCGSFGFEKGQLENFREKVAGDDGAALSRILARLGKKGYRTSVPELKKPPPPYPADHPRADLLRHKSLAVFKEHSDLEPVLGPGATGFCLRHFKELRPVFDWLNGLD